MEYLSKNIVLLRNLRKESQVQISAALGFKRTTWNNYESGVSTPSLEGVFEIAKYFGVSVEDLVKKDLKTDVNLITKYRDSKYWEKVNLNVNAIVNGPKRAKSESLYVLQEPFNPSLNDHQNPTDIIMRELHNLSDKVATIEAFMSKKITELEGKLKSQGKAPSKK